MKLFRVFDAAEFVLDANVMLDLRRLPPEHRQELLAILEDLVDQVWMPLQFYAECRENLASAHRENKKNYHSFKQRADSCRDKSLNLVKDLVHRTQLDVDPRIVNYFEQGFALLDEEFPALLQPKLHGYNDIERRIDALLRGKERKALPKSLREDIPSLWAWRMQHKIPPGLQDSGKPEPQRYGDLIGWLQIKQRATDTKRPIVFITNDKKPDDWFAVENGEFRGPHSQLVQELRDEVGVELYIYTSEQFIQIAELYLREREIFVSHAKMPLHLPRIRLPDFDGIAAMASISALDAELNVVGQSWKNLQGAFAGIDTLNESWRERHDSLTRYSALGDSVSQWQGTLAGFDTFGESWRERHDSLTRYSALGDSVSQWPGTLAGFDTFGESWRERHDSLTRYSALGDSVSQWPGTLAGFDTFGESWRERHDSLTRYSALDDSVSQWHGTLAGFDTISDSRKHLYDALAGIGSLSESMDSLRGFNPISDSMKHLHDSMAGISAFNDRTERFQSSALAGVNGFGDKMERLQSSLAGISTYSDRMDRFHDSLPGVSVFYDRMDILDQQRMPHMMLESVLDERHKLFEPAFEQQRSIVDLMKPYLVEQQSIIDQIMKNLPSSHSSLCGEKTSVTFAPL